MSAFKTQRLILPALIASLDHETTGGNQGRLPPYANHGGEIQC